MVLQLQVMTVGAACPMTTRGSAGTHPTMILGQRVHQFTSTVQPKKQLHKPPTLLGLVKTVFLHDMSATHPRIEAPVQQTLH